MFSKGIIPEGSQGLFFLEELASLAEQNILFLTLSQNIISTSKVLTAA